MAIQQPVQAPTAARMETKAVASGGAILDQAGGKWQPLYDNTVLTTGQGVAGPGAGNGLQFFIEGFNAGRSWEDTNVQTQGQMAGGVVGVIHGIAVKFEQQGANSAVVQTDFNNYRGGLFTFYVNEKAWFRLPVFNLGGLGGVFAASPAIAEFNNGNFSTNDYWHFPQRGGKDYTIPILSEMAFRCEITYRATPPVVAGTFLRTWVYLIGDMTGLLDRG